MVFYLHGPLGPETQVANSQTALLYVGNYAAHSVCLRTVLITGRDTLHPVAYVAEKQIRARIRRDPEYGPPVHVT